MRSQEGSGRSVAVERVEVPRGKAKRSGSPARPGSRARGRTHRPYAYAFRLRAVQLYVEEGYAPSLVAREMGCSEHALYEWARNYREYGEAGLKPKRRQPGKTGIPPAVKDKIVEIKKARPWFGSKRIAQFLRRVLLLPASAETVRKTLHEHDLVEKPKTKPKRNPSRPRFFERATPNQMWQTDILTFRLGGKNAYVIGYMDDYSRFLTGLGLFRSQTAEHVLEVYRRAVGEYGVPREMLTDNGRQYTNWRGSTRFEKEIKKDRVHHLKSRPHHPMTLGKIERFWKTILTEFLTRAQFDSFEQACERTRLWVQYYNHRRPHQGIGGLCPADRFFEVHNDLRKVIEQGMAENVLELALRGKPQRPFYMVGRLDDQSVVMQARKGKVLMTVKDHEKNEQEELVYDVNEGQVRHEEQPQAPAPAVHGAGEVSGRAGDLDRTPEHHRDRQGTAGLLVPAARVAEPGAGGDAACPGAEAEGGGPTGTADGEAAETAGEERPGRAGIGSRDAVAAETSFGGAGRTEADELTALLEALRQRPELIAKMIAVAQSSQTRYLEHHRDAAQDGNRASADLDDAHQLTGETMHDQKPLITETRPEGGAGTPPGGTHPQSPIRVDDRDSGSPGARGLPENLLRMGEPCPQRHDGGAGGSRDRSPEKAGGHRETGFETPGHRPREEAGDDRADPVDPRDAERSSRDRWSPFF